MDLWLRNLHYESEQKTAPTHDQRDHATKGTSRMICSLQPSKKKKKNKEKSTLLLGLKILNLYIILFYSVSFRDF